MSSREDAIDALRAYTLGRGDPDFIHQHVVDAFAAQRAHEHTRPIQVVFALIGLYLLVEGGWSGKQVQRIHMRLGQRKHPWPTFVLPADRGSMTEVEVMAAPEGPERDAAIHSWCRSVWEAWAGSRDGVISFLREHGITLSKGPA